MVSTVRGYAALMEVGKIFLMVGGLWGGRNMAIVAVALGTPHKIRTRMNKLMAILFALVLGVSLLLIKVRRGAW